jgi:ribosomal protein S25
MKPKEEDKATKKEDAEAAGMPPALKEALEKKKEKEEKEKASESDEIGEAESALEEVEAEETVDLSVGSDETETESAEASVRAELVEFVSARLGNTSK